MDPTERHELERHYSELADEALLEAYSEGPSGYRTPEIWHIVQRECQRRSLLDVARDELRPEVAGMRDDAILQRALRDLQSRRSGESVVSDLIALGLQPDEAADVVTQLTAELSAAAKRRMIRGAFWCLGGLVVTGVSYAQAVGGGTYVLAWGAILFGAIDILRGLTALRSPPN